MKVCAREWMKVRARGGMGTVPHSVWVAELGEAFGNGGQHPWEPRMRAEARARGN